MILNLEWQLGKPQSNAHITTMITYSNLILHTMATHLLYWVEHHQLLHRNICQNMGNKAKGGDKGHCSEYTFIWTRC